MSALDRNIRILETYEEMEQVEKFFQEVWPGSDLDVIPAHILITVARNGGLVIGSFDEDKLTGIIFGFLGFTSRPGRPALKHTSHQLGVLPEYRDQGLGFKLKRAQWQMVRKQNLELVTWTYDPLLSRNAHFNIVKLGAVCSAYKREAYGQMRDATNIGLPSDRFQVDWWVNTRRVDQRLSSRPRTRLDLAHFLDGGAQHYNHTDLDKAGWPLPQEELLPLPEDPEEAAAMLLVEIPSDFPGLKAADMDLALVWRLHTRTIFETLFKQGYLVTDFVFLPGQTPRSYYVLSRGDNTLGD